MTSLLRVAHNRHDRVAHNRHDRGAHDRVAIRVAKCAAAAKRKREATVPLCKNSKQKVGNGLCEFIKNVVDTLLNSNKEENYLIDLKGLLSWKGDEIVITQDDSMSCFDPGILQGLNETCTEQISVDLYKMCGGKYNAGADGKRIIEYGDPPNRSDLEALKSLEKYCSTEDTKIFEKLLKFINMEIWQYPLLSKDDIDFGHTLLIIKTGCCHCTAKMEVMQLTGMSLADFPEYFNQEQWK